MAQVSVAMPPQLLPNEPLATICPAASQSTIASTVRASDWNVFSRQSAIVEPRLPQTNTLARVTA